MTIKDRDPRASNSEKFEPWMIDKALQLFAEGDSITSVCVDLDITRETYYNWRDNPEHPFSNTAKRGELSSQQFWERAGRNGVLGGIDKFAGSSWQFIMKNRFREHYSDQQKEKDSSSAVELLLNMLVDKNK